MKAKASLPIVIAAALFLVIIIVVIARVTFAPPAGPDTRQTASQQSDNAWLTQKAKESGGDFNKLAPADQEKVQTLTKGKGGFVLSMIYQNNK